MSTTIEAGRHRVGLASNARVRQTYVSDEDLGRLDEVADFSFREFALDSSLERDAPRDRDAELELALFVEPLDALIVCHGAPYVSADVIAAAAHLTLLGELEGDRFGRRFDLESAWARGVRIVDTSNGSSLPTAEWALGLALIGRRNAGALFRRMIAHEQTFLPAAERSGPGYEAAELAGKTVGMIGFGHIARRLVELLEPFGVRVLAHDPFAPQELADAYDVTFADLHTVMGADVVFVLVAETPGTVGLVGAAELGCLRAGSVLVNVSRGKVVDSGALLLRLQRSDVVACLDVFDPEPLPVDSPLLDLPNVFCTPHIAGVTEESRRRFFSLMVDECLRHFGGLEPQFALTPEVVRLRRGNGTA